MFQPLNISQLKIKELEAYSKSVVNLCYQSNFSSIILCSPFVSLKDKLQKYSVWIIKNGSSQTFEEILRRDTQRKRAIKALEHALLMHLHGKDAANCSAANSLLRTIAAILEETYPFTTLSADRSKILSILDSPNSIEAIKTLKLAHLIQDIEEEDKKYHTFCSNTLNDLFLQKGIMEAAETRKALEQTLAFFLAYIYAIELSNSDPSWNLLSKRIAKIENFHQAPPSIL